MSTVSCTVQYRPVRAAYLVRPGSIDDIISVAGIASMLRGGILNPIVPVSVDLKRAERLVNLFCVDALFGVAEDPAIDAFKARHQYLNDPHNFRDSIFYEDWQTKKLRLAYLDVISSIELHWQAEIRHKPTDFKSNAALVRWAPEDTLANLFPILFGSYTTSLNLLDDFDAAFLNGLKAHEVWIECNAPIDGHLARRVSPITCTADGLIGGNRWPSGDGVYIGNPDNFEDLVTFWNLRAAGGALTFFSPMHTSRMRPYVEEHLQDLDARNDGSPNRPRDNVTVYYLREQEAHARAFADTFTTARPKVLHNVTTHTWNGINVRPSFFHFDYQKVLASTELSFNRPVVTLALPDKKFLPKDAPYTPDWQHLAVSLNFFGGMKGAEHTLRPPFLRQLNEFYSRAMAFDPWALRIEPEGIALIIDTRDTSAQLYPLAHQDLLLRIFELAGVKADKSQAGRLAFRIIANMREYLPLEACRVFKIRGVRLLLKTMRVEDELPWEAAMKTIAKAQFGKFKELYIESRRERELKPHDALRFLIEKRILKPRLKQRPIDWLFRRTTIYKCGECGLASSVPMKAFEGAWNCPFCNLETFLPPKIGKVFNKKDAWRVRKAGLFAKDNNQEGAIPTILTFLAFARILDGGEFLYSTALECKVDKLQCETDLCILHYGRGADIEIAIGECKALGKITDDDRRKMTALRNKFQSIGLNCYIVFAKTDESFSQDEVALFQEMRNEQIPLVLFTNNELEPYEPYRQDADNSLPIRFPMSLADMARNSDFIYLRD